MKPNPYYQNEAEKTELMKQRDAFTFSEYVESPKLIVLVAGREGSGKTHLACTMNELGPVYLLDTEYRAQIVTRKFQRIKFAVVKSYMDLVVSVKHILKHQEPGTIVIDSASDLQTFGEILYLERTKLEKVYPIFNWAEVWSLCNAVIDDIKFSQRFNLVLTARVKDEWIGEKPTGQTVPRIYNTLPYKSDIVLQYSNDKERKLQIIKDGFTGGSGVYIARDRTLPQIIKQLSEIRPAAPVVSPKVNPPLRKVS